jgi:hypothetical protein
VLNELGYDAYIAPGGPGGIGLHDPSAEFCISDRYDNIKLITQDMVENMDDTIVIYGQTNVGNIFNSPNVVRWVMGIPDLQTVSSWGENDYLFWYAPYMKYLSPYKKDLDNDLYLGEFYKDIYVDLNLERDINTWTLRKAIGIDNHPVVKPEDFIHSPEDIFFGSLNPNPDAHNIMSDYRFTDNIPELVNILNRSKRFYSYDTCTFLNIQAVMCGADSIMCPLKGMNIEDYHKGYELHKFVAFGIDDIERARSVRDEFHPTIDMIEKRTINQIHEFVDKCNKYFNK